MKIYSFHNKRFEGIFNIFKNSISAVNDDLDLISWNQNFPVNPSNSYHKKALARHKVLNILEAIKSNRGEHIIFSDVDIVFLNPFTAVLSQTLEEYDLAIQSNPGKRSSPIDSGFMGINCTAEMLDLFTHLSGKLPLSSNSLEDALSSHLPSLKFKKLDTQYASVSNNGLATHRDNTYLFHANREDQSPSCRIKVAKLQRALSRFERFSSPEPQEPSPRIARIKTTIKNQEKAITDFIADGCPGTDKDCKEIWESYQNELNKPGCQSCIKRKIVKKYFNLINGLEETR